MIHHNIKIGVLIPGKTPSEFLPEDFPILAITQGDVVTLIPYPLFLHATKLVNRGLEEMQQATVTGEKQT